MFYLIYYERQVKKSDQFDINNVKRLLPWYVINDQQSIHSVIKMLQSYYSFDVVLSRILS
ncbi:MAG: hypothetical protein ACR5K2_01135 [Wolbachia sp.]